MSKSITVCRHSDKVFGVKSNFPFWSDGAKIDERVAFDDPGEMSNIRAQSIDRANGMRYILVSPFAIRTPAVIAAAQKLEVGQAIIVSL